MPDAAMLHRIAKALGRESLSAEEYAEMDIDQAVHDRREQLKAEKSEKAK